MALRAPSFAVVRQIVAFSAVGVMAFFVDAAVLYAGIALGLGLVGGRVVSYLAAVTVSWALNRYYTFSACSPQPLLAQWARFAFTQLSGATLNLGTYYLLLAIAHPVVVRWPVLAVAAGSLAGLSINFIVARLYVFREGRNPTSSIDIAG
jgi:putative flippase GtrA